MRDFSRRDVLVAGAAVVGAPIAAASPLMPSPARAEVRADLPIPAELRPDATGVITLAATTGAVNIRPGQRTPSYGYNGPFLGPALRLPRGKTVTVAFTNTLPEATTVHWHGLIIPGAVDGGPERPIPPGGRWQPILPIDQPAATLWFHPHAYPTTASQVTKGLAGLLIIDDGETDRLGLPSHWGVDEIPIILQDRRFQRDGQFFHRMNLTAVTSGYVGDIPLVNGARYPQARTAKGWVRLRLLDGSNARSYLLKASDDRSLFVIGSDGGLLESPVELKQLAIHAGERFEVMVDCRSGVPFDLVALPTGEPIMRLPPFDQTVPLVTVLPDGADGAGRLPDRLATLPAIPAALPAISQALVMNMFRDADGMAPLMKAGLGMGHDVAATGHAGMAMPGMDHSGMDHSGMDHAGMDMSHGMGGMAMGGKPMSGGPGGNAKGPMVMDDRIDPAVVARVVKLIEDQPPLARAAQLSANGINGVPFSMNQHGFTARRGEALRWRLSEGDDTMPHPVHIHGCQFRILSQDGHKPEAHRAGWKDTTLVSNGGSSDILVTFRHQAAQDAPYMAHCHILEHEDSGMMTHFTVA